MIATPGSVICSFRLVACLAQAGEVERAEELFDQLAGYANDLGLLAEEPADSTRLRTVRPS